MKVLHISNNYTPYSGGVVRALQALLPALIERDVNVKLITLEFEKGQSKNDPDYVERIPCPLKFQYKNNPMAVPFHMTAFLQDVVKSFKPNVIHTHHPFLLGSAALKVAKKNKIPIVFTYHTMYEEYAHYIPLPEKLVRPIVRQLVHAFCESVDGIIVPSTAIKTMLVKTKIDCPITIIPSGLSPDFLALAQERETKVFGKTCRLLVVSRFTQEKNLSVLLTIMAALPAEFALTLVGFGAEYENLRTLAYKTLKLSEKRVHFVVKPARKELIEHYKDADIFLFPSHTDTQALVLAEAMAAGLPVIALDGPGQRDSIEQGKNGFIVQSADEMKEKIKKVWADKPGLEKLSRTAKKKAQQFAIGKLAAQVIEFYGEVSS